jgi:acyl carrier protein
MKHDELITKLKRIILPYIQDEKAFQELSMETDFIRDLKINSANLVDIVLDVEDEFNIKIENDDMEEMISVEGAMGIIRTRLKEK